jgi:K+:H+ antiporter
METDPIFFYDLAYVFIAAAIGGGLAWVVRQPLILGYVLGGLLVGPFTPGPVISHHQTFELFAEIGVVLLMFSIGMEFSLKGLAAVKWVALGGGPLGIVLLIGLTAVVGWAVGWSPIQSIVIGAVVSVASTMVLARLLIDYGLLHSPHGQVMLGITLVEDVAVIAMTVLLPTLGTLEPGHYLSMAEAVLKATLILLLFGYIATKVVPLILRRVAQTKNQELFRLVTLAIGLGTAALTQMAGLSLALGAFLAGVIINQSGHGHETLQRLRSLRDVFVALFFVTIGMLIDPAGVFENLALLTTILALIMVGKLVMRTAVVRCFGYSTRTSFFVAAGLTQIGEFSFILVQAAKTAGHIGEEVYNAVLAASLITILLNAMLVRSLPGFREEDRVLQNP